MKKWNALLQENLSNTHKIESLKEQMVRQKQTYEHQLSQAHNMIIKMNSEIPKIIENKDKSKAANFLVDQMSVMSITD
jgi:hypothetical protein